MDDARPWRRRWLLRWGRGTTGGLRRLRALGESSKNKTKKSDAPFRRSPTTAVT